MSDRRWDDRAAWPWWRRAPVRFADWLYRFLFAPFMTKVGTNGGAIIMGGMTRWSTAAFTVAVIFRLVTPGFPPLGPWDAITVFFVLYALPIDGALSNSKPKDVTDLLGKILPGGGSASSSQTSSVTVTQDAPDTPTEPAPRVPGADV